MCSVATVSPIENLASQFYLKVQVGGWDLRAGRGAGRKLSHPACFLLATFLAHNSAVGMELIDV